MEKRLEDQIRAIADKFLEEINNKKVQVISHLDTDGITSATIMAQTLRKLDVSFSVKIIKSLEPEFIYDLNKEKITLFLDLASGSLEHIKESGLKKVFIIDHHEISGNIPENVSIVNPEIQNKEKLSASCLTYLFCRELCPESKKLAKLAILGMIGDTLESNIDKLNHDILNDGDIKRKRGLLIYPSTRPLNRVLEFSSDPYIPGVTGNPEGVKDLLRESGIKPVDGKYKTLLELDDEEMSKIVTAIMLKNPKKRGGEIIGDIFLIKLFNKLEDARELSAMINACSRLGKPELAIQLLLEDPEAKKKAAETHIKYKQHLISGLKLAAELERIQGKDFIIINAQNKIKDTMIGTIASILSSSLSYEEGTIITTMAYYDDKIKVSGRIAGKNGRNIREIFASVIEKTGGTVGGHQFAAGCIIKKEKEKDFIELLKKTLEIEMIKV